MLTSPVTEKRVRESVSTVMTQEVIILVTELMHSRTYVHQKHLSSLSYAEHMALGNYYENIGDYIDRFVETYQGSTCELLQYPPLEIAKNQESVKEYLVELLDFVKAQSFSALNPALDNIIAELCELLAGTIYKLTFLK